MPAYVLWTGTVNTTERTPEASWDIHVNADSPVTHELTGTVDGDDAALAVFQASDRVIRCEVDVDLGGGWETLVPDEYRVLSLTEDIDNWSDQATLELYGARWNPLVTGAMRGQVPIRIRLVTGDPSQPVTRTRFVGYVTVPPYDRSTRTVSVTALDEAAIHAEKRVAPYIVPEDEYTREGYMVELLEDNSVPIDSIDLGDGAVTPIIKPVSQFDTRLFDFLRDWISPCGAWLRFRNGGVYVFRYSPDRPVARVIGPQQTVSISQFTPPPASTPNKITAVTVNYDKTAATGYRTEKWTEETTGIYARKGAIRKQAIGTGTITTVSYGDSVAVERKVAEARYEQRFLGDVLVYSRCLEFGWYARRIARLELDTDGTTVRAFPDATSFQYADGSWRYDAVEKWIPVRETVITKTLTAGAVTRVVEQRSFYGTPRRAAFELQDPGPAETWRVGVLDLPLGDDGVTYYPAIESILGTINGWTSAMVSADFPAGQEIITDYYVDDDGFLVKEVETMRGASRGTRASAYFEGGYGYSPNNTGGEYWTEYEDQLRDITIRTVTYTQIDDESYIHSESLSDLVAGTVDVRPSQRINGSRPQPERNLPQSRSQELRQSATDEVREDLNGTIEDWIQNEYCQDANDLQTLANARLREESAWPFVIVMPIDQTLHVGDYIEIDGFADDGLDGLRMMVAGVTHDITSATMTLRCRYYPPEVADA